MCQDDKAVYKDNYGPLSSDPCGLYQECSIVNYTPEPITIIDRFNSVYEIDPIEGPNGNLTRVSPHVRLRIRGGIANYVEASGIKYNVDPTGLTFTKYCLPGTSNIIEYDRIINGVVYDSLFDVMVCTSRYYDTEHDANRYITHRYPWKQISESFKQHFIAEAIRTESGIRYLPDAFSTIGAKVDDYEVRFICAIFTNLEEEMSRMPNIYMNIFGSCVKVPVMVDKTLTAAKLVMTNTSVNPCGVEEVKSEEILISLSDMYRLKYITIQGTVVPIGRSKQELDENTLYTKRIDWNEKIDAPDGFISNHDHYEQMLDQKVNYENQIENLSEQLKSTESALAYQKIVYTQDTTNYKETIERNKKTYDANLDTKNIEIKNLQKRISELEYQTNSFIAKARYEDNEADRSYSRNKNDFDIQKSLVAVQSEKMKSDGIAWKVMGGIGLSLITLAILVLKK